MEGHISTAQSVCFTHDGTRLVSGGYDRTVRLWNAETGQQVLALKGHSGSVDLVALGRGGESLLSAGGDDIRLWKMTSEAPAPPASAAP